MVELERKREHKKRSWASHTEPETVCVISSEWKKYNRCDMRTINNILVQYCTSSAVYYPGKYCDCAWVCETDGKTKKIQKIS